MNRRKAKILFMSLCLMICMVLFVSNNTNAASKKPTKMTLNVSKKTVDVGGTYQIKVKSVSPSKASKSVAYKSSNTKIATISSKGIIKGKKEGTAKITVKSKKNKKLKKTVVITVKRLKPYSLTLNKTKLKMNVNDTYKLKATVKASSPITWNSSNKAVVSVDKNGIITAKKDGTVTITVKTTKKGYNGKVLSKSCKIVVSKKNNSNDEQTPTPTPKPDTPKPTPTPEPSKPDKPNPSKPDKPNPDKPNPDKPTTPDTPEPTEPTAAVDRVHACLYSDGELVISVKKITPDKKKTVVDNRQLMTPARITNDASKIKKIIFSGIVKPKDCSNWFLDCENLTEIKNIEKLDTSECTRMDSMFGNCSSLKILNLNTFDTSKVTNMNGMFCGCSSIETLDLNKFNTKNVSDISGMFSDCEKLTTLNIDKFNTSNVKNMNSLFSNSISLKNINLDNFDTRTVTNMCKMFFNCSSLTSLNLCNFNTQNIIDMSWLFRDCTNLKTITVSDKWTTENANINRMFQNCGTDHVTKI